jgi:hypothetical protein
LNSVASQGEPIAHENQGVGGSVERHFKCRVNRETTAVLGNHGWITAEQGGRTSNHSKRVR